MAKYILIFLLVVAIFNVFNSAKENKAEKEVERLERKIANEEVRSSINNLVARHSAFKNWDKSLSKGETYRFEPILTIELEKLWLISKPILFVGSIEDIMLLRTHTSKIT